MESKSVLGTYILSSLALPVMAADDDLKGSRPNIILVMTDDQGMGDLSCMGNKIVRTPNIDKFYNDATRFTNYMVSPTSAPTRSAIMSGRMPFKNGVTHTILQRERMSLDVFTMPQALQTAGYSTGIFGKWHLGDDDAYLPTKRGFDEALIHGSGGIGQVKYGDFPTNDENVYFDNVLLHNDTIVKTKGFCTDLFFKASLAWIKKQHQAEKPYFAYIALNAPHGPMVAPDEYKKRFIQAGYDKNTAGRYGMIENIDYNFGVMMDKLQKWGVLDDNTIIIFTTDNGMSMAPIRHNGEKILPYNAGLKGHKNSPNEGGNHVPFFVQWRGVLNKGIDIESLIAHIDLYSTFCELAGAKLPDDMQKMDGKSFLSLLENPKAVWEDRVLFDHCGRWPAGKRDDFKYIKSFVRTSEWRLVNNKELYNIKNDPGENIDVADKNPEIVEKLSSGYDLWWKSVLPLMVNENEEAVKMEEQPLYKRYYKQLREYGIPEWEPDEI